MKLLSALRFRIADQPLLMQVFTFCCFASGAVFGSAASVVYHGGALWSATNMAVNRLSFPRDPHVQAFSLLFWLYGLGMVISSLLNGPYDIRMLSLLSLATFALFPISYTNWRISSKPAVARAAVYGSAFSCYGALVLALLQVTALSMRGEGGAGNSLVFASVTCLASAIALAGSFILERRLAPLLVGAFLAGTFAIILSGSRSIWLGPPIHAALILWVQRKRLPGLLSRPVLMVVAVIVLAGAAASVGIVSDRLTKLLENWHDLTAKGDYTTSLGLRIAMWEIGTTLVREKPIFGHGMVAMRELVALNFEQRFGASGLYFSHLHNALLTTTVKGGIVGAMLLVAIFGLIAKVAWTTIRRPSCDVALFGGTMLAALFCTYMLAGLTNLMLGHDIMDAVFMIGLVPGLYLATGVSGALQTAPDDEIQVP